MPTDRLREFPKATQPVCIRDSLRVPTSDCRLDGARYVDMTVSPSRVPSFPYFLGSLVWGLLLLFALLDSLP